MIDLVKVAEVIKQAKLQIEQLQQENKQLKAEIEKKAQTIPITDNENDIRFGVAIEDDGYSTSHYNAEEYIDRMFK